jgi:hypothetical protein
MINHPIGQAWFCPPGWKSGSTAGRDARRYIKQYSTPDSTSEFGFKQGRVRDILAFSSGTGSSGFSTVDFQCYGQWVLSPDCNNSAAWL